MRALLTVLACVLLLACVSTPPPTDTTAPTAGPTQGPTDQPTGSPAPRETATSVTPDPASSVTIDLAPAPGAPGIGTVTATDNGDETTTLSASLPNSTDGVHPWFLYPGFTCRGAPAEDAQLPVALPDIENGSSSEVVDSAYFNVALAVVVFADPGGVPMACGILPDLAWNTASAPTAPPTPDPGTPTSIVDLVDTMELLVLAGDAGAYLGKIDLSDPVFATEHTRWAQDWATNPPEAFDLSVSDVTLDGSTATGTLTVRWSAGSQPERSADLDVSFTQADDGTWEYAGERWVTHETDHFRIRVAPGLESEIPAIEADLPEVYEHVTGSIGYAPNGTMEIKVYPDASSLVATVQLGLPDIRGWNEPGEALKVRVDPQNPTLTPTIAHEFTHFAEFDQAGTQRSRQPWWLSEGIATYVAEPFGTPGSGDERLATVREWAEEGALADWSAMEVFEETPQDLWTYVYPQGYAMTRYVTETYGEDARNEWLAAMSTEMDIEAATDSVLGLEFDELAADFEDWLLED